MSTPLRAASLTILLIGRDFRPGSQFLERLCRSGCACAVAKNLEEARASLLARPFDLVLSDMALPDGSALPLLDLLEGTPATLFFCVGVHDGCWWLPALARGRRTWGEAALRPTEFAHALDALLAADPSHVVEAAPAAAAEIANIIPMPPIEIAAPKPERIEAEQPNARKSSA